jgi:PHD/YefM family antitoxin component YafN of YafNO toxin-antitoxin module
VLTKNGQMRAVVVSVDYFAALRDAVQPPSASAVTRAA